MITMLVLFGAADAFVRCARGVCPANTMCACCVCYISDAKRGLSHVGRERAKRKSKCSARIAWMDGPGYDVVCTLGG